MRFLPIVLLGLALGAPALAHDDATLDQMPSPHGGQMRMAGPYHFELVPGQDQLRVYLSDHASQPVSSAGVGGNAVILSGGAKASLTLTPGGAHWLDGTGAFQSGPDMKVVVSLSFPDGTTWQARFTPWERMRAQPAAVPAPAASGGHPH